MFVQKFYQAKCSGSWSIVLAEKKLATMLTTILPLLPRAVLTTKTTGDSRRWLQLVNGDHLHCCVLCAEMDRMVIVRVQASLDEATDPWGVKVERVEMWADNFSFIFLFLFVDSGVVEGRALVRSLNSSFSKNVQPVDKFSS